MSTRTRSPRKTKSPAPLTAEQVGERIKELEAIGVRNHHELAARTKSSTLRGGLWFAADFLPPDLKTEWDALKNKAA
jgi:hypothetical protein